VAKCPENYGQSYFTANLFAQLAIRRVGHKRNKTRSNFFFRNSFRNNYFCNFHLNQSCDIFFERALKKNCIKKNHQKIIMQTKIKYDIPKRVFLVKKNYELKEISLVQRSFRSEYPNQGTPSHFTINNLISNFEKTGTVTPLLRKRKNIVQKREKTKKDLKKLVSEFPNLSIRKAACALDVSPTIVYYIFQDDLHLKPYKFHIWHKLEAKDYEKRKNFANWVLKLPFGALEYIICSDEGFWTILF
jgi:hypothetical protein